MAVVTNISYGPRVGLLGWEVDGGQRERGETMGGALLFVITQCDSMLLTLDHWIRLCRTMDVSINFVFVNKREFGITFGDGWH